MWKEDHHLDGRDDVLGTEVVLSATSAEIEERCTDSIQAGLAKQNCSTPKNQCFGSASTLLRSLYPYHPLFASLFTHLDASIRAICIIPLIPKRVGT